MFRPTMFKTALCIIMTVSITSDVWARNDRGGSRESKSVSSQQTQSASASNREQTQSATVSRFSQAQTVKESRPATATQATPSSQRGYASSAREVRNTGNSNSSRAATPSPSYERSARSETPAVRSSSRPASTPRQSPSVTDRGSSSRNAVAPPVKRSVEVAKPVTTVRAATPVKRSVEVIRPVSAVKPAAPVTRRAETVKPVTVVKTPTVKTAPVVKSAVPVKTARDVSKPLVATSRKPINNTEKRDVRPTSGTGTPGKVAPVVTKKAPEKTVVTKSTTPETKKITTAAARPVVIDKNIDRNSARRTESRGTVTPITARRDTKPATSDARKPLVRDGKSGPTITRGGRDGRSSGNTYVNNTTIKNTTLVNTSRGDGRYDRDGRHDRDGRDGRYDRDDRHGRDGRDFHKPYYHPRGNWWRPVNSHGHHDSHFSFSFNFGYHYPRYYHSHWSPMVYEPIYTPIWDPVVVYEPEVVYAPAMVESTYIAGYSGYRRVICYNYGPSYTVSYVYPNYHRRYMFVSVGGYWPSYSYARYYWYGCHPYVWYGAAPTAYVVGDTQVYTYNRMTDTTTLVTGSSVAGVQVPDYDGLVAAGRRVQAEAAAEPATQPDQPSPADTLFDEAVKAFGNNDYATAIEKLRTAVRLDPNDVIMPYAYAQALFANNEYEKAAAVVHTALMGLTPQQAEVFYPRGMYQDENLLTSQIKNLERAVMMDPTNSQMQLLLGYHYLGTAQLDQAMAPLTAAQRNGSTEGPAKALLSLLEKVRLENKTK